MNDNVFAVSVGYSFGFIPAEDLDGINIDIAGAIRYEGENWNLFKATNYADSRKIDTLLDRYGEYPIKDYKIEPVIMCGSVEMTVPGFDTERDSLIFGAYSFMCNGKEIPIDFSGTSWNIDQDGDKILVSFETGRTPFLTDCFLDDCYEDTYRDVGLRINDITAEFLSKASSIAEFGISMEFNGEELALEDISRRGGFAIKSLSFENSEDTFSMNPEIIQKFNQSLAPYTRKSLSSIIDTANSKCVKSKSQADSHENDFIR